MKLYKLTNQNHETYNNTKWGEGVEHTAPGGSGLCNENWLHAYTDPLLAVLLNPIHADIKEPILWEAEGDVGTDDGLKVGCTRLKTIRQVPLPEITTEQRVKFAIACAREVNNNADWLEWADKWESGKTGAREQRVWRRGSRVEMCPPSSQACAAWVVLAAEAARAVEAAVAAEACQVWEETAAAAVAAVAKAARAAKAASGELNLAEIAHKVCD
jgi:hypothetical protein